MSRALLALCLLPILCAALLWPGRAVAVELRPGHEVALAIDSAMAAGSAVSIVGSAVTLARGKPDRSWIITGYFFGTINMAISPLLLVYGRDPDVGFGLGMGVMHGVLGVTNFVLSVVGGVRLSRILRAREQPLALVPSGGRDTVGQSFAGLGLRLARF